MRGAPGIWHSVHRVHPMIVLLSGRSRENGKRGGRPRLRKSS
jgi:hypothetical protein